ncbi:hypothetical protein I7I51_08823 [Histoplasma capsulatum]|uniref:Uncharacterized protein n=1 Tax=Ajellomyces capsulatus TaxID=5037 RepID=A0A8A1LYW8_AJECA|nr:hypothetical protein I7I51_08823 [Histoplasma capsulatum]
MSISRQHKQTSFPRRSQQRRTGPSISAFNFPDVPEIRCTEQYSRSEQLYLSAPLAEETPEKVSPPCFRGNGEDYPSLLSLPTGSDRMSYDSMRGADGIRCSSSQTTEM